VIHIMSVLPSPSIQMARSLPVGLADLAQLSAFDLFQSQLEAGSTEAMVDAMKRLGVVAVAMGPKQVQSTLLPYLTQLALQQPPHPDELLLLLGQQLPNIAGLLGKDAIPDFLPMLERLAAVEETVVRDQAVIVMNELCTQKSHADAWMGVAKRLAAADWFTAKVSACGIIAPILALGGHQDIELLAIYKDLCQDETPMVRRAAAKYLGSVLNKAGWAHRDFCAASLPQLCRDEQDSVRLLAVASLANVGPSFGQHPQWTCQHWLPIVKEGSTDMSW